MYWVAFIATLVHLSHQTTADWRHMTLDADDKFNVSWTANNETITFKVAVRTEGWIGLGVSSNGGMRGADIMIVYRKDDRFIIEDRHATGEVTPILDESQDLKLIEGNLIDGVTSVTISRKLTNCDQHDRDIGEDTTRLIWAYGNRKSDITYHGVNNRGSKSVYLLDSPTIPQEEPGDMQSYDFVYSMPFEVPGGHHTYYSCGVIPAPHLTTKHHVISFEPIITPGNEGFVHHMVVHSCHADISEEFLRNNSEIYQCSGSEKSMPPDILKCRAAPTFTWAVGGEKFYLPDHVGMALGGEDETKFFLLDIHFDNPTMAKGRKDNSGIRVNFTPKLRPVEAGTITVGTVSGMFIPPRQKEFKVYGVCSPTCTSEEFPSSGVNVFAGFLHAHLLGREIVLSHQRAGLELSPMMRDDSYDFNYQDLRALRPERQVLGGDQLVLRCVMDSAERTEVTYGEGTIEEMCTATVYYYPRTRLSGCSSAGEWLGNTLALGQLNKYLLNPMYNTSWYQQKLDKVNWTSLEAGEIAQNLSRNARILPVCLAEGRLDQVGAAIPWTYEDPQKGSSCKTKTPTIDATRAPAGTGHRHGSALVVLIVFTLSGIVI